MYSMIGRVLLCCGLFFPIIQDAVALDDESTWRIIMAGVLESMEQLEVKAEFTYQRGVAIDLEDAKSAKFVNQTGDATKGDSGRGLLVKQGNYTRLRLMYDTPTDFNVRGRTGFSIASIDFACGPGYLVTYYPKQLNLDQEVVGGTGRILRETQIVSWTDLQQFADEIEHSPIFATMALLNMPTLDPDGKKKTPEKGRYRLVAKENDRYRFEIEDARGNVYFVNTQIRQKYPVVLNIESKYEIIEFSDFIDLSSGISIARRVTNVRGPFDEDSGRPFWIGHIWQATSYVNEVSHDDFNIEFDANPVANVAEKVVNVINLVELKSSATDIARLPIAATTTNPSTNNNGIYVGRIWIWTGGILGVVFCAVILVLFKKRLKLFLFGFGPLVFFLGCGGVSNNHSSNEHKHNSSDHKIVGESDNSDIPNNGEIFKFGKLFISAGEHLQNKATFLVENGDDARIHVKVGSLSCSCVSASVDGREFVLLEPGDVCEFELTVPRWSEQ